MIDTDSPPGAWQREIDQRPKCAHKTVRHAPQFNPDGMGAFGVAGTWRDRWICESCGQEFRPKGEQGE